ncbi:shikimate dehydrogenase [Paenibacillus thermotolerans]|uniref:shikimate dehydrogenase n=1 Tax=Paenibacillus thermotolerans TaxID=3027807 RepID=UPI002368D38C|nr:MULTISPECIES: shikimate dehydrogenase [unclassified Paenibacillus]
MGETAVGRPSASFAVNSETVFYGVFGDPVRHSKSPVMLGEAFRAAGMNAVYGAFHVTPDALGSAVEGVRALGFRGVNVTIPHKVRVMEYLDEIDATARKAGAVNTIVNEGGRLIGYNTDGIGYVRSLKEETGASIEGSSILMLGAGGAARGVAHALAAEKPSRMWIANRSAGKAEALVSELAGSSDCIGIGWDGIDHIIGKVDIIVNTTPIGMHPNTEEMPVDPALLREGTIVSDLIYNPLSTKLLMHAEQAGAKVHGGLGMFVYQGAYAFEYWTGAPAPVEAMRAAVLRAMEPPGGGER